MLCSELHNTLSSTYFTSNFPNIFTDYSHYRYASEADYAVDDLLLMINTNMK